MIYKRSSALFAEAKQFIPGGVNSPVRAFKAVGGDPIFVKEAKGAYLYDVDGNRLIDYIASWGPLILGHAHEPVLNAIIEKAKKGTSFGMPTEIETELANLTHAPHGPEGPLYPGTCRGLKSPPPQREPAWRLNAAKAAAMTGPLTFTDQRHGVITVEPELLGDVILARKDIGTSYHLAVVVDDAAQEISHVTRGEDLLGSTHIHRVLQNLLQLSEPCYLHHSLIMDESGQRLAKRHDALSIETLRERGEDVWNLLPSPSSSE